MGENEPNPHLPLLPGTPKGSDIDIGEYRALAPGEKGEHKPKPKTLGELLAEKGKQKIQSGQETLRRIAGIKDKFQSHWPSKEQRTALQETAGLRPGENYGVKKNRVNVRNIDTGAIAAQLNKTDEVIIAQQPEPLKVDGVTFVKIAYQGGEGYIATHYLEKIAGRALVAKVEKKKISQDHLTALYDTIQWRLKKEGKENLWDEIFARIYGELEKGQTNDTDGLEINYKLALKRDLNADRAEMEMEIAQQTGAKTTVEIEAPININSVDDLYIALQPLRYEMSQYYRPGESPFSNQEIKNVFNISAIPPRPFGDVGSQIAFSFADGNIHFLGPKVLRPALRATETEEGTAFVPENTGAEIAVLEPTGTFLAMREKRREEFAAARRKASGTTT